MLLKISSITSLSRGTRPQIIYKEKENTVDFKSVLFLSLAFSKKDIMPHIKYAPIIKKCSKA